MPPTLLQRQQLFAQCLAELISWALGEGYFVTLGEVYRSPEEAKRLAGTGAGIVRSLHCDRLAADLNLFKAGRFLTKSEEYAAAGTQWKSIHPLCRWGGDFKTRPDGNHFSIEYDGRQ